MLIYNQPSDDGIDPITGWRYSDMARTETPFTKHTDKVCAAIPSNKKRKALRNKRKKKS